MLSCVGSISFAVVIADFNAHEILDKYDIDYGIFYVTHLHKEN